MLVCMHILAELLVEEMTWNRLLTLLFFLFVVGCHGKDIRFTFFSGLMDINSLCKHMIDLF